MHLYAGTVDHIGEACPDDDEFVRTELMPVSQIPEILAKQEIRDVKPCRAASPFVDVRPFSCQLMRLQHMSCVMPKSNGII